MTCISEDDLLALVNRALPLGDAPAIEAHLADCPACSALLAALAAERASAADEAPGREGSSLGPYRLGARIGAGAMGEVYRAVDERLGRHVAVKVLSPRAFGAPDAVRRLIAEGRAAAAIAHPNVVTVFDVGSDGDVPFIVSELIEGETLRSRIDRARHTPIGRREALELGWQLARGLAAAHAKGVVHRDLKPHNLIVTADGTLKILDFGLAKLGGERGRDLDATEPGAVLGTAGYLSPEQARGEPADARSDLFTAGAILYEMATRERAFGGATFAERLSSVLRDRPPRLDDGTLGEMTPIVSRCLEKDAAHRFQSAEDLAWALKSLLDRPAAPQALPRPSPSAPAPPRVRRRTMLLATAAAGISGVALGRYLGSRSAPDGPVWSAAYQQLTYRHGRVTSARFTPDGASVIYAASWDGLPLEIHTTRLGGGGTRPLNLPSADVLSVSSRGEIAFSLGHRHIEGFHTAGHLAVAPLEGGEPRLIAEGVQEADYTPDGRELAVIRRGGSGYRVEIPLGRALFEAEWVSHARVSPDGARVACLVHPSPHDDRGGVVIVERATGRSRTISDGWSSIEGLAWAPDGAGLWFSASRDGANNGVVAIDLDGRETFTALTTGRLRLHDVAKDGRAAVTHDTRSMPLRVRAPGALGEVDMSLSDVSLVTDMSADGKTIVFGELGDVESARGCYLRPTSGQPLRLGDGAPLALSDDGRRVLAMVYDPSLRLVVYSTAAGEVSPMALGPLRDVGRSRWRGDSIVITGAAEGRPRRLWRTSIGAAAPTPITDEGISGYVCLSSDGARVAFVAPDGRLLVITVGDAASMKVVPGTYADEVACRFREWDREIFLGTKELPIRVRRVDVASGASTPHLEITPPALGLRGLDSVVLDATGDAYAYSYGRELSRLYAMSTRQHR